MRVVQDATRTNGTRRGDPAPAAAQGAGASVTAQAGAATSAAASGKALPLLQAALFLLACVIGGVAVAVVRPF